MSHADSTAVPAYQGYEYQIVATVWIALQMMLSKRLCPKISIEPAFREDVEAKLEVDPERALSQIGIAIESGQLDVQIKLRRTSHWTEATFRDVIQGSAKRKRSRGPAPRKRPLERLRKSSKLKFLLLTNAQVQSDKLGKFLVTDFGERSQATTIPDDQSGKANPALAGRIGILAEKPLALLRQEINEVLRRDGHVPSPALDDCIASLKQCVRDRLLGERGSDFTIDEIQHVMRKYGGFPTLAISDQFIPPDNFKAAQSQLRENNSLYLAGSIGSGKTTVADVLIYDYRVEEDPYTVVKQDAGVDKIRELLDRPEKYVFHIEDPWGKYRLSGDYDRWLSELPKLLIRKNRDKKFVITSRTGIAHQASGGGTYSELETARIEVAAENYDKEARWKILNVHLQGCTSWQRDLAVRERVRITAALEVPLALASFAAKLRRAQREEDVNVEQFIKASNTEAIAQETAAELEQMQQPGIAGGILLWALYMGLSPVRRNKLGQIRQQVIAAGGPECEPKRVYGFLVDTGRGSVRDGNFDPHPTVLEGLELLVSRHAELADDVLSATLMAFSNAEKMDNIRRFISRMRNRRLPVPSQVQARLNAYLLSQLLAASDYQAQGAFFDVARLSTDGGPAVALVKYLTSKEDRNGFKAWRRPELQPEEVQRVAKSNEARECAIKFIRGVLPFAGFEIFRPDEFVDFVKSFGWDLSAEFLTSAKTAIEMGQSNVDFAVTAALRCENPPYEEIISASVAAEEAAAKRLEERKEELRKADQAEMDAAYASHVCEGPGEEFYPSEAAFETTVRVRRRAEGYKWLVEHPARQYLMYGWGRAIDRTCTRDELQAFKRACGTDTPRALSAIRQARQPEFAEYVLEQLAMCDPAECGEALETLCALVGTNAWPEFIAPAARLSFSRRATICNAAISLAKHSDECQDQLQAVPQILLEDVARSALNVCHEQPNVKPAAINNDVLTALNTLAAHAELDELAAQSVSALSRRKQAVGVFLPRLLRSKEVSVRTFCLRLASKNRDASTDEQLFSALADENYQCRRAAMYSLAEIGTPVAKKAVLAMADDRSAPVREACAEIIGRRGWTDAAGTLVKLLSDNRDNSLDMTANRVQCFHVARQAAISLHSLGHLDQTTIRAIVSFLENRNPRRDDPAVYYYLVGVLASVDTRNSISVVQSYLTDDWYMRGYRNSGFPLRFSAAWGLVEIAFKDDGAREIINPTIVATAAENHDARLAGPSLITLGLLGDAARESVERLLDSGSLSLERLILLLAARSVGRHEDSVQLRDKIGASHPVLAILDCKPSDENDWKEFLKDNPQSANWIESIGKDEDVNPALRLTLEHLVGEAAARSFETESVRKRDLAEPMPVITLRSMIGGE